jgi:hypothetical protein
VNSSDVALWQLARAAADDRHRRGVRVRRLLLAALVVAAGIVVAW